MERATDDSPRSSQRQNGGVIYANAKELPQESGAVSLIGSTVTGCSAGQVRRVELAAAPAAPHGRGPRYVEGHGCHIPLFPRNHRTAASSTQTTTMRSH